ncbi:Gfo/Idh/MocA family oxidoreductase [bacterium]|nr:Gfo/Idh/MocA family oxidoreductase [bacterium]
MAETIGWGICSTGGIAHAFASDLARVENAQLVAVGSRRQQDADAFGQRYNIPHRHPSYEALAADPTVDVVYVATPHAFHYENALLFLKAGKSVLVEKPFAINARQTQAMIDAARANNVFLMEAHWTHFLPGMVEMQRMIREGAIGEVKMLDAAFCFDRPFDPQDRLYNPHLGRRGAAGCGRVSAGLGLSHRRAACVGEERMDAHCDRCRWAKRAFMPLRKWHQSASLPPPARWPAGRGDGDRYKGMDQAARIFLQGGNAYRQAR